MLIRGLVVFVICLGIAWWFLPPDAIWSPDEGAKLLQVQNLRLRAGQLDIAIQYTGRDLDPTLRFAQPDPNGLLRVRDNALFLQRLPLFSLLVLPCFHWLGFWGLYLLPAFGAALSSMLGVELLPRHERRWTMWLLMAFGSPLLVYGAIFWEHTLASGAALAAAWLALRTASRAEGNAWRRWATWIAVGALLALSVYLRLELLLFAAALLLACWLVLPREHWTIVGAGVVLGVLLLPYVALHRALFGQPVADNALYLWYPFTYLRSAGWQAVPDLLIGPFAEEAIDPGIVGQVWTGAALVALGASVLPENWAMARAIATGALCVSAIVAAAFLLTSVPYRSAHGLLFTTPWALLGLCRAREVWRRGSPPARVVVLAAVFGLAAYVIGIVVLRASSPQGGLEWGARFALTFYPLLALMAGWNTGYRHKDIFAPALLGVLLCLGIGFQLRGLMVIRQDKAINASLNQVLMALPERNIVSDTPWFALNTAPLYGQKATFEIASAAGVSDWIEQATSHGVTRFCLVTLNPQLVSDIDAQLHTHQLRVLETHEVGNIQIIRLLIKRNA